jgi:hypothetical protein
MMGWLEVVRYWVNRPQKKWLNWTLGGIFVVLMILPAPGLLTRK